MIRLTSSDWGLLLTFTSAVGCSGGGISQAPGELGEFDQAACRCWDLINLGDVYFSSQEQCERHVGAFALGVPDLVTECTLEVLQSDPASENKLQCHIEAMEAAIPCFEAIDSCDYTNDYDWNNCMIEASGFHCGDFWDDPVFDQLYPACLDEE